MGVQYNTIENVPIASFETSWKNDSANQPIKSIVAEITPTQDLHGYEYPWPRNGGKNRIVNNLTESWVLAGLTMTPNTDGSITVEIPEDITTYKMVVQNTAIYNGGTAANQNTEEKILKNGTYRIVFAGDAPNYFSLQVYGANSSGVSDITQIVSGSSGTFTIDDSFAYNWVRIITKSSVPAGTYTIYPMILDASETDLSWEPQQNICPITGRTGSLVNVQGKNFFVNRVTTKITSNNYELTPQADGSYAFKVLRDLQSTAIIVFNSAMENGGTIVTQNYGKRTLPNGQYRAFFPEQTSALIRIQVLASNNPSGTSGSNVIFNSNSGTIVIDDTHRYNWIRIYVGAGLLAGDYILKPTILRQDDTDFTWTKYVGNIYPISWQTEAGTVYGGTVDIVSGLLTVTMANIASYNGETIGEPWLSSMDKYAPGATPTIGAQVVYTLSSPQTYQLTAQQINTLLGTNNVWADSGNINKLMWQYTIFDILQVFINGFDITDLIAFGGWQRERNDVDGPEAGRTLDAKMHRARVATKMRYNVTCRPLLAEELAALERLIMPEYVTVKVVGDPYYGTWERTCYVNNTSAKYLIHRRNGAQWWSGITFPIIEV